MGPKKTPVIPTRMKIVYSVRKFSLDKGWVYNFFSKVYTSKVIASWMTACDNQKSLWK